MNEFIHYREIEYAGFNSWPAKEQQELFGIILRYSDGYTKRANSANVLEHVHCDFLELVEQVETYFNGKNIPCVFRLTSFSDNKAFDHYLADNNYALLDHSLILTRSVSDIHVDPSCFVQKSCDDWMISFCSVSEESIAQHRGHLDILKRIKEKLVSRKAKPEVAAK